MEKEEREEMSIVVAMTVVMTEEAAVEVEIEEVAAAVAVVETEGDKRKLRAAGYELPAVSNKQKSVIAIVCRACGSKLIAQS